MLKAIKIGNFKAFADTQRIPIKPLTLIYGANSSGKSSILHSLLYARNILDTGDYDVTKTTIGGDAVDLGGFSNLIHRHDFQRKIEFSFELNTNFLPNNLAPILKHLNCLGVSLIIDNELDQEGYFKSGSSPQILSYDIFGDNKSIMKMSRRSPGLLQLDHLDTKDIFHNVLESIVKTYSTIEKLLPLEEKTLLEEIDSIVPELFVKIDKLLPTGLIDSFKLDKKEQLFTIDKGNRIDQLAEAVKYYMPKILNDLINSIYNKVTWELLSLHYLGPLRSYPERHFGTNNPYDPNWIAGGGSAWDIVKKNTSVREKINQWLTAEDRLQTPYELIIRKLVDFDSSFKIVEKELMNVLTVFIDPFLESVSSLFEKGKEYLAEIGKYLPEMLHFIEDTEGTIGLKEISYEDLMEEIINNQGVEYFGEVMRKELYNRLATEFIDDLVLMDRRSNTVVSHRDIGIGVSQVLPVLVQAYALQNKIIAIEQPEIHLHPALQADLGDLFIESALGENKNRFLIETHSEHLLLRIMRRIRETNSGGLPSNLPPIKPKDVSLLFVLPKGTSSVVLDLELDEEGQLLDPWPGGFFEEGFRERFS